MCLLTSCNYFCHILLLIKSMPGNHKHKGWNQQEDRIIKELVEKHGSKSWAKVARQMVYHYGLKGKTGKQCRQRWYNHLNPGITKDDWSKQQEDIMFEAHKLHGNKWKLIAEKLPGRTDNSIKNHFYSTIRRSLRRMSKLTGSKNSTHQMRKIKPLTLSRIFCVAQGRQMEEEECLGELQFGANANSDKKNQLIQELKQNCLLIAQQLMVFARHKPSDFNEQIPSEQRVLYARVIEKMSEINCFYEGQKQTLAKIRKQKKLEKNFDYASVSSQDEQQKYILDQMQKSQTPVNNIKRSRTKRNVRPPTFNPMQSYQFYVQKDLTPKKQGKTENINSISPNSPGIRKNPQNNVAISQTTKDNLQNDDKSSQKIEEEQEYQEQYQFSIDLQRQDDANLFGIQVSPGIRNTPLSLTPTVFESMMRQPAYSNMQPIKNCEFDNVVSRLRSQIQKNTLNEATSSKDNNYRFFPSPMSAFRQCE